MPKKSRLPIEQRRLQAVKRSREYYDKNKIEIRKRCALRMKALRQNNLEYREKERKHDAFRRAKRQKDPKYREKERAQNTVRCAKVRANPQYREKERKCETLGKAACHKDPEFHKKDRERKCHEANQALHQVENPQSPQKNENIITEQ